MIQYSNDLKITFLLLLVILFSNCQNKHNDKATFVSLKAHGKSSNHDYIFCSFIPQEVKYSYRSGMWKFMVNDTLKFAEGPYDYNLVTIDTMGGCSFSYYINSVDVSKWFFWDLNGKCILPNQRFKNIIESKDTIWPMINLNN